MIHTHTWQKNPWQEVTTTPYSLYLCWMRILHILILFILSTISYANFSKKMPFLMFLGWKYSYAFIPSHVADKNLRMLLNLLALSPSIPSSWGFRLLPRLFSPPSWTHIFAGSSPYYQIHPYSYLGQTIDSCRVAPCLKPKLNFITYLASGLGPYANQSPSLKRMSHSAGVRAGPAGAHWVVPLGYSGVPNSLETVCQRQKLEE